jgi:hypothetical protein
VSEQPKEAMSLKGISTTGRIESTAKLSTEETRRLQLRILDLFGTIDFDPTYDYKAERKRKRL